MASSSYILNLPETFSMDEIEDYDQTLLARLGNDSALEAVLEMFIEGVLGDDELLKHFDGVNPAILKLHHKKFFSFAFTKIPSDVDAQAFLIERHYRLFANGLNETHFDRIVMHLEAALAGMWVDQKLIDEVKERVAPFRSVFEEDSREYVTEYVRAAVGRPHFKKVNGAKQTEVLVDL